MRDAAEAIEFYKRVFGAKKRRIFHGPDGNIIHAEIQMGDSILFLSPEFPEMNVFSPPIARMMKFNEELAKTGALISLDGLH